MSLLLITLHRRECPSTFMLPFVSINRIAKPCSSLLELQQLYTVCRITITTGYDVMHLSWLGDHADNSASSASLLYYIVSRVTFEWQQTISEHTILRDYQEMIDCILIWQRWGTNIRSMDRIACREVVLPGNDAGSVACVRKLFYYFYQDRHRATLNSCLWLSLWANCYRSDIDMRQTSRRWTSPSVPFKMVTFKTRKQPVVSRYYTAAEVSLYN